VWVRTISALAAAFLVVGAAAAATGAPGTGPAGPTASAHAQAVRILLPNGKVVGSDAAVGDSGTKQSVRGESYSYPGDGSVVVTGGFAASTTTKAAKTANARAAASASNISLFDGEITLSSAGAHATAATSAGRAGGSFTGTGLGSLQALGRPHAFGRAALADWGYLVISAHKGERATQGGSKVYDGVSVALDVHRTAAHGGLPAGSEIQIGYAAASAATAPPAVPEAGPQPADDPSLLAPAQTPLVGDVPQLLVPALTAGPYVFPVYGPTSSSDRYGTARQGSSWQHGIDVFGGLGQPLVAVSTGTLYAVGWNHAAGNRLWLRDRQGNTFLYSHLSAFSTLASNGAHVRAGQVIGFMGNTGNSGGMPTHLHFEVHPVSMLFLGQDGAADPGRYLAKWRHMATLAFAVATGWAPKVPGTIKAPEPAAVPLTSTDISTASGLDPTAVRRALRPAAG
jgi:murein DD-endopeptidase MepM/ murein hydrolase activator NlpD